MLYAIFFLLLIVFFPILSIFLGIGFVAVIVKFWWVILLFIGISVLLSYGRKVNDREAREEKELSAQQALIEAIKSTKVEQQSKLSYTGESNLENDSYILFLVKKYAIEKNDVLGKYVLNEKLYPSIDEALKVGDELEQAEQEQRLESFEQSAIKAKADERAYLEMLTARKSDIKKLLVVLGVILVAVVIGRVGYLKFHSDELTYSKDSWNSKTECEVVAIRDVTEVDTDGVTQQCFMSKNMKDEPFESCPKIMKKGDKMYLTYQSIYTASDGKEMYCEHGGLCFPKKAFVTSEKCSPSEVADNQRKESDYSKFSKENQELIKKWTDRLRDGTGDYWDADIRKQLNQAGICYGMSGQSRAEYDWHKCSPKSFKDY